MTLTHLRTVPILRIFDEAKAREFYFDFLGFRMDRRHRLDDNAPLFMEISRDGIVLNISEHHGDGTPGSLVRVDILGIRELHAELIAKKYRYMRPGLERPEWGGTEMTVVDPFANRIIFVEPDR